MPRITISGVVKNHGKDEFLQAIQVLVPQFWPFGTFAPNSVSAGGSVICLHKNLLPDGAITTHVTTCQGRDHIVTIQFGDCVFVVVNVHFEPDMTLRGLRERLRFITPHWPLYPGALGVVIGDFGICELEEGRFNVWNQTFTEGDAGKTALFWSFVPHVLEIAEPHFTWKDSAADGTIRTLSRIDREFDNLPIAKARDYHCCSHVFENLGERSIPSDHAAVRVVFQKPTVRCDQVKRTPSRMSQHAAFCSILKQISDGHQYPADPLAALADIKVILEKASKQTHHELLRIIKPQPLYVLTEAGTWAH